MQIHTCTVEGAAHTNFQLCCRSGLQDNRNSGEESLKMNHKCGLSKVIFAYWQGQWALCPAALLPELQPAPCFLYAIIGKID